MHIGRFQEANMKIINEMSANCNTHFNISFIIYPLHYKLKDTLFIFPVIIIILAL